MNTLKIEDRPVWGDQTLVRNLEIFLFLILGIAMFAFASILYNLFPTVAIIVGSVSAIAIMFYLVAAAILKVKELIDSFRS